MKNLTRKEELILLAVHNLKKDAYLISIVGHLSKLLSKKVSLTSVHLPLSRLEELGIIEAELGAGAAVRGGRRKKIYRISKYGYQILDEHKKVTDLMWEDYRRFSSSK